MKVGDTVFIKKYRDDERNRHGVIKSIREDGWYWVANLNMPFSGSVSDFFKADDLEIATDEFECEDCGETMPHDMDWLEDCMRRGCPKRPNNGEA